MPVQSSKRADARAHRHGARRAAYKARINRVATAAQAGSATTNWR
jgi:hypothetical protein